ncbi:MAG: hypothetical protein LH660_16485, partial [Phormidesmis sp. CAN_BIN36]|nr:hypothetical protein [Phormidesmis sp. CAN_BIN36]
HPSPLPKGEGTRLLAPFSLGRRVGEGFAPLREEGDSYFHSATPIRAGSVVLCPYRPSTIFGGVLVCV